MSIVSHSTCHFHCLSTLNMAELTLYGYGAPEEV